MATEIFQLLGKIGIDGVEDAHKALDDVNDSAGKLGSALSKAGQVALGIGKAVAVGMAAAGVAVAGLVKASVEGYAEYEQLVGGVKTLFNETELSLEDYAISVGKTTQEVFAEWSELTAGARWVVNNAQQAYITAGLSANEYMETVTSFSASLLQSLGGDTVQAAHVADMAITDMADNANKMGTSMESIQNAYQGFAKQNYTMLDNLKLGYGGTRSEMERLLKDAQELTGIEYDISNLNDVYQAIHVIQKEMGITGATAKEAMTTIQGSANATKAAWRNLVVAFATDEYELEEIVSNFVDSAIVMVENIAERVQEILPRLVEGLEMLIEELTPHLKEFVTTMLPGLIEGATTLVVGLIDALPDILQILIEQLPFILTSIGEALVEAFPALLETVKMLFGQIWDYIAENLFGVEGNFDETFAKVEEIFNNVWVALQGIWDAIGQPIWDIIQSCIDTVRGVFEENMPEIEAFVSKCFEDISQFWEEDLKPCLDAIQAFIEETLAPAFEWVFTEIIAPTVDDAFAKIEEFWDTSLKPTLEGITTFLTGVFQEDWELAWQGLVDAFSGIWEGIKLPFVDTINWCINKWNEFASWVNADVGQGFLRTYTPIGGSFGGLGASGNAGSGTGGGGNSVGSGGGRATAGKGGGRAVDGGVLERGQVAFLEGAGAEAIVPLENNRGWITRVAEDMNTAFGGTESADLLRRILDAITAMDDAMAEKLSTAVADIKLDINNREFARMVKAVN